MKKEVILMVLFIFLIPIISAVSYCNTIGFFEPSGDPQCNNLVNNVNGCDDGNIVLKKEDFDSAPCSIVTETNCNCNYDPTDSNRYTECSSTKIFKTGSFVNGVPEISENIIQNHQTNPSKCFSCNEKRTFSCESFSNQECENHYFLDTDTHEAYNCKIVPEGYENAGKCSYKGIGKVIDSVNNGVKIHKVISTYFQPCNPNNNNNNNNNNLNIPSNCNKNLKCFNEGSQSCRDSKLMSCQNINGVLMECVIGNCRNSNNRNNHIEDSIWIGKDCNNGKGFINKEKKCVEKNCENVYTGFSWKKCGDKKYKYSCCKIEDCNERGNKGMCCDKSTKKVNSYLSWVKPDPIVWCNPKECPFEKTSGDINGIKISMCCDKGEKSINYHAGSTLSKLFSIKLNPSLCGVECKKGLSKCRGNEGNILKDVNGKEICCSKGKECVLFNKDNNIVGCVPKSCPKNEQICKGKPGTLEKTAICCPKGSVCFWHPNGAPMCYIIDKEVLPKTDFKIKGDKLIINLPHASTYVVKDGDSNSIGSNAYRIDFVNFVSGSQLIIPNNFKNPVVEVYPDYFINNNCEINVRGSDEKELRDKSLTLNAGKSKLVIPKPSQDQRYWKVKFQELYLKCRNFEVNQFPSFKFDKNSNEKSKKCFIATVVYGDIDAPQVQTLREIRDKVLMKNYFGKKFIDFYYSGAGEKTADFIKKDMPFLIPVIRKGLDKVVEDYNVNKF